ncbi:YciI family protein [Roseateles cellulosilyticus]|uniref:YciI family protein n=1 Tax=Pelomonas cellulosilytica TaxID=2906762 RepID=A0ABS8Y027_9BURK|nr:YciI family protein [Pelomonas sp. P8]MCE4557315.1 YciI family protein [Pelomonas sp. P8]
MKAIACLLTLLCTLASHAQEAPAYDAAKAQAWGATGTGMRAYTFVLLKTGPKRMPDGAARDEMFKGHFANMARLAKEGLLVYAGPLDGVDGMRGLFIFATADLDAARRAVDTDPVIINGEMVAELHKHYGSAALLAVNEWHPRLVKPQP